MNKKKIILFSALLIILALVFVTTAAAAQGAIDDILGSIAGKNWDISKTYAQYGTFIDMVIYFLIFLGVAQMSLLNKFQGKGGKLIVVGIGVALAISLSVWGAANNFGIKNFGPLAGIIFFVLIFVAFFNIMRSIFPAAGVGDEVGAACLAISIVWYIMAAVSKPLMEWLISLNTIGGFVSLFILVCTIWGIIWLVKRFSKKGVGGERFKKLFTLGKNEAAAAKESASLEISEKKVDRKEERDEKLILKEINDLVIRLEDLTKGKNTAVDLKNISADLQAIVIQVKHLNKLEGIEFKDEKLRQNMGLKSGKMYELLKNETNFFNAFEMLITAGIQQVQANRPGPAVASFNKAKATLKQLIKLNQLEERTE